MCMSNKLLHEDKKNGGVVNNLVLIIVGGGFFFNWEILARNAQFGMKIIVVLAAYFSWSLSLESCHVANS